MTSSAPEVYLILVVLAGSVTCHVVRMSASRSRPSLWQLICASKTDADGSPMRRRKVRRAGVMNRRRTLSALMPESIQLFPSRAAADWKLRVYGSAKEDSVLTGGPRALACACAAWIPHDTSGAKAMW